LLAGAFCFGSAAQARILQPHLSIPADELVDGAQIQKITASRTLLHVIGVAAQPYWAQDVLPRAGVFHSDLYASNRLRNLHPNYRSGHERWHEVR